MHLCFFFIFIFLPIISYTSTNFLVPGRALGFHRRDSRGDWYLYRRPSADDRRGFPKPGRCIKHNHHGVFPVGLTQDCGSPSFHCLFLFCVFFVYAINVMSPSLNVLESIKKNINTSIKKEKNFIVRQAGYCHPLSHIAHIDTLLRPFPPSSRFPQTGR